MATFFPMQAHAGPPPGRMPPPAATAHAAKCLKAAYPGRVCGVDNAHVVFCDGTKVPFGANAPTRPHTVRLEGATVAEQLAQPYPMGPRTTPPAVDEEPGRIRSQAFFKALYGETRKAVARQTALVIWMPKTVAKRVRVSTVGNAHLALERVGKALDELPRRHRELAAKTSGTFVWRKIRGTQRLSAHSFGIAVDVAVSRSDYWRWQKPAADGTYGYRNRIPWPIVEAFEREGFIWGGKWYRYDTMHFEYRPDLTHPDCRAPQKRSVQ